MAYYFPLVLTTCFAAITAAGWPLSSIIERALTSAVTALAILACTIIYL